MKGADVGRIRGDLVERTEAFSERVVRLGETLQRDHRPARVVDQLIGAGTSVGCNTAESDEALSVPDFRKCLGIAQKELRETRFLLRLVARLSWVAPTKLQPLQDEADSLAKVIGTVLVRSRPKDSPPLDRFCSSLHRFIASSL